MAGDRLQPIGFPKQQAVDPYNPETDEIYHAQEENDKVNLLNRRDKERTFSSVISFNDHYSNGSYTFTSSDLTLTFDTAGAKAGFETLTRLVGNGTNTLTITGSVVKFINFTNGQVIEGEQYLSIKWTTYGAIVKLIVNVGVNDDGKGAIIWTAVEGQKVFTIPGARVNEISSVKLLTVGNVVQTRGITYFITSVVVANDSIEFVEGLKAGNKVTLDKYYASLTVAPSSGGDPAYVALGAFDFAEIDLSQNGRYDEKTISTDQTIGNIINQPTDLGKSQKVRLIVTASLKISIASNIDISGNGENWNTDETIDLAEGTYNMFIGWYGGEPVDVVIASVTSGLPQLSSPVLIFETLSDIHVNAKWDDVVNAEDYDYEFSDDDFVTAIDSGNVLSGASLSKFYADPAYAITASTPYDFRVRTNAAGYTSSDWTTLETTTDAPTVISQNSPISWFKANTETIYLKDVSEDIERVSSARPAEKRWLGFDPNEPEWNTNGVIFDIANTEYLKAENISSEHSDYYDGNTKPFSIIMVVKVNTIDSSFYNLFFAENNSDAGSRYGINIESNNAINFQKRYQSSGGTTNKNGAILTQGNTYIFAMSHNASQQLNMRVNATSYHNNEDVSTPVFNSAIEQVHISKLVNPLGSSGYSDIEIIEFADLSVALTNAELATSITELNAKYNIF